MLTFKTEASTDITKVHKEQFQNHHTWVNASFAASILWEYYTVLKTNKQILDHVGY